MPSGPLQPVLPPPVDPPAASPQFLAEMTAANALPKQTLLHLAGELLTPLPEGAIWWAARRVLVVSDLHLEKGSNYAAAGQLLPPYDTGATLSRIERLAALHRPETILSLGDSFHDRQSEFRLAPAYAERIRALTGAHDWVWIEGNHDPDPPAHLGGRAAKVLRLDGLVFRHEPEGEAGEIAGHLHPVAKVAGRGRSVRRRCFASDGARLVMPAMGAFAGGLNILDAAFATVFPEGCMAFAMGQAQVYSVPQKSLVPDLRPGGAASGGWRF